MPLPNEVQNTKEFLRLALGKPWISYEFCAPFGEGCSHTSWKVFTALNPFNAEAAFALSTRIQKSLKTF